MTEREIEQLRTDLHETRAANKEASNVPRAPLHSLEEIGDMLAQHIRHKHAKGERTKAQKLAHIRDQLSALRMGEPAR